MTVEKCYQVMKGDYKDVVSRLMTDERIKKFLIKFLSDPSFSNLNTAMENKNLEEAFLAAHTLKGIAKNLSITSLSYSATNLTEALRGRTDYGADLDELFRKVKKDYTLAVASIQML